MAKKTSWEYVVKDMKKRNKFGFKKYNKYITPKSKEDMLQEHYEELLDACVYIKTYILQQKENNARK